ncbi:mitochondrial glycoprotein [Mycena leptocephala]|nr:mitochondrial glycoprotein [Mycena leptocephala]
MSAARTLRQLASASGRISSRQLSSSSLARLPLLARTASRIPAASRAFSVSARSLKAGSSDVALSQKLAEELKYENEETPAGEQPEFLASFMSQGIWKIQDTPNNSEVVLTRQFGNENIQVKFSVVDLQMSEDPEFDEDTEEAPEEEMPSSDYMRAVVSITKSTAPGAMQIDMEVQSGSFLVQNVTYYADGKLGDDATVEGDWKRRALYMGPEFTTLDVSVQEQFEKFLEERDLGENTAFFVLEYAQYKEQREYVKWLENVKKFVDA